MGHRRNWSSEYQSLALGQLERVIRQHREGLICERTGRATDRLKVPWAAGRQLHRPFTDLEARDQFTPNVISRRRKSEKGHSSCPPCPPKALLLPSLSRFLLLLDSFPRATICYEEEKEGFPSSLSTSAASFPLIVGRY